MITDQGSRITDLASLHDPFSPCASLRSAAPLCASQPRGLNASMITDHRSRITDHRSQVARGGEIVISEEVRAGADIPKETLESRRLALKGKSEEMEVWVVKG